MFRERARLILVLSVSTLLLAPVVRGGDDDDDDNTACDKACSVGRLPPLAKSIYHHTSSKLPTFEEKCIGKVVVTAQPQDGFGGEVIDRIGARAAALAQNWTYVHTPFAVLDHVGGQEDEMESFINIGADEIDMRSINSQFSVQQVKPLWGKAQASGCATIYACKSSSDCVSHANPTNMAQADGELRERYRRGGYKPPLPFLEGHFNVAVHHRRGDAEDRILGEGVVLAAIKRVNQTLLKDKQPDSKPIHFYLFTQGAPGSLPQMAKESDITLFIDPNTVQHGAASGAQTSLLLRTAFNSMVMADAFIATKSSLGYSAGHLSYGRVFAFHLGRPTLASWTMIDDTGNFTETEAAKSSCKSRIEIEGRTDLVESCAGLDLDGAAGIAKGEYSNIASTIAASDANIAKLQQQLSSFSMLAQLGLAVVAFGVVFVIGSYFKRVGIFASGETVEDPENPKHLQEKQELLHQAATHDA